MEWREKKRRREKRREESVKKEPEWDVLHGEKRDIRRVCVMMNEAGDDDGDWGRVSHVLCALGCSWRSKGWMLWIRVVDDRTLSMWNGSV